jgi:hypothetical protein
LFRNGTPYTIPSWRWIQLAVVLTAVLAAWPLLAEPGLLNTRGGGDSPFLLQRLHQLTTALVDGHFPVRWMPDANYGYGYPFYNYYAPLSLYITAVFYFLGFSTIRAIHLAQLSGFLVAAWGAYQLGRHFWAILQPPTPNLQLPTEWAGLLTAVAYTFAPFHMVNVYVRGDSLAEFWAMAFYPWLILIVLKITADPTVNRNYPLLALLYAVLILSHNISALIFSPFLLLAIILFGIRNYELGIMKREARRHSFGYAQGRLSPSIFRLIASLLLALGLAAWFFVPALAEQSLAQLGPVTEGYFHYGNHFLSGDLAQTAVFFDYSVDGGNAFRMGLVQAGLTLLGLAALGWAVWRQPEWRWSPAVFVVLGLLVATFMLTPLSRLLWDHLPLLSFTQFPWRFLSVQALFTALVTGALALLPWRQWLVPALCLLLLVSGLGHLQTDHLYLTEADITAEALAQYEWFTGNIGTTVSAEYLPHTVQPRPFTSAWLETGERHTPQILAGSVTTAVLLNQQTTRQQWRIDADSPARLVLPTLHWPGWAAEANGEPVAIQPSPGAGLIMLDLSQGNYDLTLQLNRTPVRQVAEWLSLLSLLLWLFWLRPWDWLHRWRRLLLGGLFALILLSAGLHSRPERPLPPGTQSWDFAQLGYLHHAPGGIRFSNGAILHRYSYSDEQPTRGERLTISLELTAAPGTPLTIGLATPAHPRPQPGGVRSPLLLSQQISVDQAGTDGATLHFDLPENLPTGLYLPYFQVGDGLALTPGTAQERGGLYLRPLRIAGEGPVETAVAAPLTIRATTPQRAANTLRLDLRYYTAEPVGPNYNLSLRLLDEQGQLRQQYDLQPGHGFRPSSLWPPQQWVADRVAMPLPEPAAGDESFFLMGWLYEVAGGEVAVIRRLGQLVADGTAWQFVPAQPQFVDLPEDVVGQTAVFHDESGPLLALRGYRAESAADGLALTLYWEALRPGERDYTRFAHLLGATDGPPLSQDDAMPQRGTYPTGQWQPGELIADPVWLPLPAGVDDGFEVGIGFYRAENGRFPRLPVYDETERPLPDDMVRLFLTTD